MVPYLCNSPPKEPSKRDILYPINTIEAIFIYIYRLDSWGAPSPRVFSHHFSHMKCEFSFEALKNLRSRHLVELAWLTESQQEVTSGSALPCDFNRQDELVISFLLFTGSRVSKIHGDFLGFLKGSDLIDLRGILQHEFICGEIWGWWKNMIRVDLGCVCLGGWVWELILQRNWGLEVKSRNRCFATTSFPNAFNLIFQA